MKNKVWNQEFSDRMMKHYGELKWLYMELYNSEEHFEAIMRSDVRMVCKQKRSIKKFGQRT